MSEVTPYIFLLVAVPVALTMANLFWWKPNLLIRAAARYSLWGYRFSSAQPPVTLERAADKPEDFRGYIFALRAGAIVIFLWSIFAVIASVIAIHRG
jgi:hypothetical protein